VSDLTSINQSSETSIPVKASPTIQPGVPPAVTASEFAPTTEELKPNGWQGIITYRPTKRHLAIAAAVLILLIGTGALAKSLLTKKPKPVASGIIVKQTPRPTPTPSPTPTPAPTTAADPLTGQAVSLAAAAAPVVGVMIENLYPNARPQSGLSSAGIVYEALAEGGITRMLALFQEPFPGVMGPVRSLRPYYLDWGLEHNIPVAHAGGSQPALAEIGPLGMKNINALEYDGSYFYRISSRLAPHNLYTNSADLTKVTNLLSFNQAPTFTGLPRKADTPAATRTAADIKINFSYTSYNAEYVYNSVNNDYNRFEGGVPQIDANTGKQIQVKNLVVEFIPVTYGIQNDGDPETNYQLIGSGKLLLFEDGTVQTGTWSKSSNSAPTQMLDSSGKPLEFNVGNTWINAVTTSTPVTY
jgi:hypothetical protein